MEAFGYFVALFTAVGAALTALAAVAGFALLASLVPAVLIWRRQRR